MPGVIEAIYVAPRAKADPSALAQVSAVVDRGLEGDRYFLGVGAFSRWPGEGRAVTLIEAEAVEAIRADTGTDLSDGRHRRNLVTRGVRLPDLLGKTFRVGGAVLRGSRLCLPCRYLERLVAAEGLYDAMRGNRGGLRAEVVEGGEIAVGDALEPIDPLRTFPGATSPVRRRPRGRGAAGGPGPPPPR